MKNKKEKQPRNDRVEFGCECGCTENVEFSEEFGKNKHKNKNAKANRDGNLTRTNAYAGMTEYANELGTARNAIDTIGNAPITDDFVDDYRNFTTQNNPYPYAYNTQYEIAREPYHDNEDRDFKKLEDARKNYFEKLHREHHNKHNKQNNS